MGATGRIGLTIVGQVAGAYLGGPVGAAIGGAIGGALGSSLFPEHIQGSRLEGLQLSSSSYGWDIPAVYGTAPCAGNLIWRHPLNSYYEHAKTERQGKGGGPVVTSYTYSVDVAFALCEGEITGVRRVWLDQQLVYDVSAAQTTTGPDGQSEAQPGASVLSVQASLGGVLSEMVIHTGAADQLPDTTIESHVGVGKTPAYRGTAYLVFPNLDLTAFGNRIPNIKVEVVRSGTPSPVRALANGVNISSFLSDLSPAAPHMRFISVDGQIVASRIGIYSGAVLGALVSKLDGSDMRFVAATEFEYWPPNDTTDGGGGNSLLFWPPIPDGTDDPTALTGLYIRMAGTYATKSFQLVSWGAFNSSGNLIQSSIGLDYLADGSMIWAATMSADRSHIIVLLTDDDNPADRWILWRWDASSSTFTEARRGTVDTATWNIYGRFGGPMRSRSGGVMTFYGGMLESNLTHLWGGGSDGGMKLGVIGEDDVLRAVATPTFTPQYQSFGTWSVWADAGLCWVENSGRLYTFSRVGMPIAWQTVSTIATELCTQTGLSGSDIDVTDVASINVRGFVRDKRMPARAAIETLSTAFAFDAVESDGKIKFKSRTATPTVTIPESALGASETGSSVVVESERAQESELPRSVDVSYLDADADYQIGAQLSKREAVSSRDSQAVQLPLALQAWQAAGIAARIQYELWQGRTRRKFTTTAAYSTVEPTDVVKLTTSDGDYTLRITEKREAGNLIAFEGFDVGAAALSPAAPIVSGTLGQPAPAPPSAMSWFAADLPPLRSDDYGTPGYYAAATPYFAGSFSGGVIMRKPEGAGTEFAVEAEILTSAAMGLTINALGTWGNSVNGQYKYRGYYVDTLNYLDVEMTSGVPEACTHDEFMNLENVAVVGQTIENRPLYEIIAFRDVESLGGNRYRLRTFLRGLAGTEWHAACPAATKDKLWELSGGTFVENAANLIDGHRAYDTFLIPSSSTVQRVDIGTAEQVSTAYTKGVSTGRSEGSVGEKILRHRGATLVNPAPVDVTAVKVGSDLQVSFNRRRHVDGAWVDGRDVLAPPQEAYIISVMNTTVTARRSIFARFGSPPFTITSADLSAITPDASYLEVHVAAMPVGYDSVGASALLQDPFINTVFWSHERVLANW